MFNTVLIANRGAIATRIIRTLKKLDIRAVAVYHEEDSDSLHVQNADEAICLGGGSAAETYLNIDAILRAAKQSGAQAVHPGYGFLSENTDFVKQCEEAGIAFIGPTPEQITLFGLKHQARNAAEEAGVPLVPGSPLLTELNEAQSWASKVGYPIMLKSTAGGGGIGMQVCHNEEELVGAWETVRRLGANYFSNDGVFLEKFVANARHIEVQIFGDGEGKAISLGERDCSAQRRNQKVVEESPAPNLSEELRTELCETAEKLMASVSYRNAGTVEYIFDADTNQFYFLEVNTRLQVEHGVTEEVWNVDIVEWMLKLAADELDDIKALRSDLAPSGHAIQVRIYAEDPQQEFRPSAGLLSSVVFPKTDQLRIDSWVESGIEVPALFDPMIAKVIVYSDNRDLALSKLSTTLSDVTLYGIETNKDYVRAIIESDTCQKGELLTKTLSDFPFKNSGISVLQPGTLTTIQDWPGRIGLWHIGVPPSGPMDSLSFRLANKLLGNSDSDSGLEITLNGPLLKFHSDTRIALCGTEIDAKLNSIAIPLNEAIEITAGDELDLGKVKGEGARCYLAVQGGFDCPDYLGSRSTFTLGQFGGHNGRALRTGDVLRLDPVKANTPQIKLPTELNAPAIQNEWKIRVIYGPHGAPDFFTDKDISTFFETKWEVHYNSSRTGVRLIGPKPDWARETGGEAGLHPSNIHDNAYAFGSIDFTGDMPVILGPDGPSLGGFVCPATVIQADLWKLGQLKAGSSIQFVPVSIAEAVEAEKQQNLNIEKLALSPEYFPTEPTISSPIVETDSLQGEDLVFRAAGDHFLLVELGPLELDIARRFRVHALMLWLEKNLAEGIRELTPGIRSLQIHYDSQTISLEDVIALVKKAEHALATQENKRVPSRIVHLPLSWDDEACREAIEKYTQSVRPGAPWCPSNLEFIRRINGLQDINAVKDIVFNAAYLVMGLGDVYLGAPVATPTDPRHRLVTTKYNPARTWTAENSVGIGGAYMCIYGMEGPGGYQFVGRTLQMWNRYRQTKYFSEPWLLRFFDQVRFYEVSHEELVEIRQKFPLGQYPIKIEETEFDLDSYCEFLEKENTAIKAFETQRSQAFQDELEQWRLDGQLTYEQPDALGGDESDEILSEGLLSVDSPVSGNVWQINCVEGDEVEKGSVLAILESMKMEIEIQAPCSGQVTKILKQKGQAVTTGQSIIWLSEAE